MITDQLYIVILFLSVTTDLKWAYKNRAFWKFEVNFRGQKVIESFWIWFSLKNIKLEEQLSLMSIFIWLTYVNLYLVNLCLIFVGSFQVSSDSWDRNDHLGLISGQNCTFGCMGMFLLQSWRLSNSSAGQADWTPDLWFESVLLTEVRRLQDFGQKNLLAINLVTQWRIRLQIGRSWIQT